MILITFKTLSILLTSSDFDLKSTFPTSMTRGWFFNSFFLKLSASLLFISLWRKFAQKQLYYANMCACVCLYALHRAPFQNAIKMKTFNKGPGESNLFRNIQKWISTTSTYTNICYLLIYLKLHPPLSCGADCSCLAIFFRCSLFKKQDVDHRVVHIWCEQPFGHYWDGANTYDWMAE